MVIAADIVMTLQTVVSRRIKPGSVDVRATLQSGFCIREIRAVIDPDSQVLTPTSLDNRIDLIPGGGADGDVAREIDRIGSRGGYVSPSGEISQDLAK